MHKDRAKLEAIRDRSVAWMTAALQRQKRLPSYERFVEASAPEKLSSAEMAEKDAEIEGLAASAGLAVMRDPEPEAADDGT